MGIRDNYIKKMLQKTQTTLYIDPKDLHLNEDDSLTVHPKKINMLSLLQKESFDHVVVQNVPTASLTSIGLFHVLQALKKNGIVEIFVEQPISVMQSLDAAEIETNAKLAGFVGIKQNNYEKWVKEGQTDVKVSTIRLTMLRGEK